MTLSIPNRSADPLRRLGLRPAAQLWAYLGLIAVAELITSLVNAQLGQLMHVVLLAGLALHAALAPGDATRRFLLGLMLAPLIRILSLSLPLSRFPQLAWYPIVAVPLLFAAWVIIRQLGLSRNQLGLRVGNLPLQLGISSIGLLLGVAEHYILAPRPQFAEPTWVAIALASLNLLIFTGFTEELIFRGILQVEGQHTLGRWSLLYISLLFGVLHIGYLSLLDVVFVSGVGLVFAYMVRRTGSIFGVTIAHGLTNSMLFLIMPYFPEDATLRQFAWGPWALAVAVIVPLAALTFVFGFQPRAPRRPAYQPRSIGVRRRQAGLTWVELAMRAGLPARTLWGIEHGMHEPRPDELQRIAQALRTSVEELAEPGAAPPAHRLRLATSFVAGKE